MNKRPSRMQGQFYFSKLGKACKEHGLHTGNEGGVLGVGPSMGPLHVNARKMVNLMASESGSKWCER
jgi:hypothetical protein